MSRDYIEIGSSPTSESCAQVGSENYYEQSRKEMKAFIKQLRRLFGDEPFGARLSIKAFPHDFGTYHEVVCHYEDTIKEAVDYAFKVENYCPESWDEESLLELGLTINNKENQDATDSPVSCLC
jgi:hypothetical protein